MEEQHSTTLSFYPSKIKNVFFVIMGVVFVVGGTAICYTAFKNEDYLMSLLGGGSAILFTIAIPLFIKRIINPVPSLVLTEKELIMNPGAKHPIPIKWEDIEGYRIRDKHIYFYTYTFIEIILYDEEKYQKHLSKTHRKINTIGTMGGKYSLFYITLGEIKVTERDLLFYALDYIHSPDFDVENVPSSKLLDTMDSFSNEINQEYFKKNYILSLILAIFSMVLFYSGEKNMNSPNYMITSFVLFPFAKLMFDVMIGFKLKSTIEKQPNPIKYVYHFFYLIGYFLLFLVSPFVGPIGILYLITRTLHRWIKKRNNNK